jgi:rRNA-processing protein FCF1
MHDIICNESISNGEVSDDAVERYVRDIKEALDIFTKDEGLRRG